MTVVLSGPHRGAASGHKPTSLIVFLHGYGSDGQDLFSLSVPLAKFMPDAAFAAPNAPFACEMGGPGFQWFGLQGPGGRMEIRESGADLAAPILAAYLAAELARLDLDSSRLALVGFSQGTMMALHVGLYMTPAPAAIVGFSGMLIAADRLSDRTSLAPPILLIHGDADPVVPFEQLIIAATALRAAGIVPETFVRPGLGHGIDDAGLTAAAKFLQKSL